MEAMNDKDPLFSAVMQDIADREQWRLKQATSYRMRHSGIPRKKKPYPGAPDVHFPLADTAIEKLKPVYLQGIYSGETLARFTGKNTRPEENTDAEQYFHYELTEQSNYEWEIMLLVDNILESGRAQLKVWYDAQRKQLRFDAVEPTHLIVPKYVTHLRESPRITHVIQTDEHSYRQNPQ